MSCDEDRITKLYYWQASLQGPYLRTLHGSNLTDLASQATLVRRQQLGVGWFHYYTSDGERHWL